MKPRKVLLIEINEITWRVIDALVGRHGGSYLPNFARLRQRGAWGVQVAEERAPHLDPWITWVTAHTGVPREVHGASVLEQDSVTSPRTWEIAARAGLSVGVFGSIGSYPPPALNGFVVPGPFAPGPETHPATLEPIQALNRVYTQVQNRTRSAPSPLEIGRLAVNLVKLGLRPATVMAAATHLLRERINPTLRWRRPALQPLINLDFFARLYGEVRPDYATWHTNHAAHFMHHYWRAWDDTTFQTKSSVEERTRYGDAVPYGYRLSDWLIGRFMKMLDDRTVLVVASSMGQTPYRSEHYTEGKIVVRIRSIEHLLEIVGSQGVVETVPTMVPQWNIRVPDPGRRRELKSRLESVVRGVGGRREQAIYVEETEQTLTVTPLGLADNAAADIRYYFDTCPGAPREGYPIQELFALDTPTVKQGMHHPEGVLAFFGAGIVPGLELQDSSNLDIAPTILSMLGVPVPADMHGRALLEATMPEWQPGTLAPTSEFSY